MHFYRFLLGTLCVWRVTHMLNAEDGPGDVIVHLRRRTGEGFFGQLLDCFYCLSVWIAALPAILLGEKLGERVLLWPALSAGAILLERVTDRQAGEPPVLYVEDKEDDHGMLRRQEGTGQSDSPAA
jgi:hypothetical protein